MYALQNPGNKIYKSKIAEEYVSYTLDKAMKFKTQAEAEFILQDLKSRSQGLNYRVVEVT